MMTPQLLKVKTTLPLTLIDRFHPHLRDEQQEAINTGHIRKLEEIELLEPEQLRPLALLSVLLLLIGALFFGLLNYYAYTLQTLSNPGIKGGWSLLLWILINIIGYILILPIHELIHAAAFVLWGGKPYFGTKLPYALYCGAKNQLFHRNQYLVVGLAPLVVITLAGIIFILLSPALASYTIFAIVGNFSGAAGDVWVVRKLMRRPRSILVEDTEAGYRAWELTESSSQDFAKP
jgi:signal transduction histidine kinase